MRRSLWLLFLAFIVTYHAGAVTGTWGHTIFYLPDANRQQITSAYLETFWQVNPVSLHYHKNSEGALFSKLQVDIVLRADTGIVKEGHYLINTNPVMPDMAASQKIADLQRFSLPYGKYTVSLDIAEPEVPGSNMHLVDSVSIRRPDSAVFFGSIQLLDTFFQSKAENIFSRNGNQQIPLFTGFVDDDHKTISFYTEYYLTNRAPNEAYPLLQRTFISKKPLETPVRGLEYKDTVLPALITPVSGRFDLSTLVSGNYYVNAVITDRYEQVLASSSAFFQLINSKPVAAPTVLDTAKDYTVVDLNKTFLAKYNFQQVKAILKMLRPIVEPQEAAAINNFLKQPNEMYMRYFIYNYFAKQNEKDPEKPWKAYTDKVREVNRLFGNSTLPGYETDRGYIYLKYGKPNDIIPVPAEQGALPYEVWQYFALGKQDQETVFLFYKPGGSLVSDMKLLHSTLNGELKNPNWRSQLFINGGSSTNSRAEQYIRNR
jgi:GWxTD domain-containing protein